MRRDVHNRLVFFRCHCAQSSGMIVDLKDHVIRKNIELLLALAVNILTVCRPQQIAESGTVNFTSDDFGSQSNVIKQTGEDAGCTGMLFLIIEDMAFNGDYSGHDSYS